jgi:KEOPS complex subunit Cgi121
MIEQIEEFGKFVAIIGFRGVEIGDAKAFLSKLHADSSSTVSVQVFNADLIASSQHLYFAALNALTAFKNNRALSKSLAVETVLYASAQRQIKKALDLIGLRPDSCNVAFLVIANSSNAAIQAGSIIAKRVCKEPDEGVLELSHEKIKRLRAVFDISDAELDASTGGNSPQALVDAVVERMALLATRL